MQNDVIGLIYRQPVTQALLAEMILVAGRSDIPSLFLHSPADAEHFILEQAKPLPLGNLTDLVGRRERQCRLILAPEIWLSGGSRLLLLCFADEPQKGLRRFGYGAFVKAASNTVRARRSPAAG